MQKWRPKNRKWWLGRSWDCFFLLFLKRKKKGTVWPKKLKSQNSLKNHPSLCQSQFKLWCQSLMMCSQEACETNDD